MKKALLFFTLFIVFIVPRSYGQVAGPINGRDSVCVGHTISLTDTTPGLTWVSSNPAIATVDAYGHVTGIAGPGTVEIYYNGTPTFYAVKLITVMPSSTVTISALSAAPICAGVPHTFYETITGGASVWNFEWAVGGAYLATGDTFIYTLSPGDTINLIYASGCLGDTITRKSNSIIPLAPPNPGIITGPDILCFSAFHNYVLLTDTVAGGTWSKTNNTAYFFWGGLGEVAGNYSGIPGIDTILYIVTNVCGADTATHPVTVSWCGIPWSDMNCFSFDAADTLWQELITIDTVHYHHNQWQVGRPQKTVFDSAYSLPNAIVTDTLNPYAPNDTSAFTITFPGSIYPGGVFFSTVISSVRFNYKLDIDSDAYAEVDLSIDSGKTWINLKNTVPPGLVYYPLPLQTSPGWHEWSIDGNVTFGWGYPYDNQDSLMVKFVFVSGANPSGKDGWMIDDLCVYYTAIGEVPVVENKNTITLSPNPATTTLTIKSSAQPISQLTITNLQGQAVYSLQSAGGSSQANVDVSQLLPGIYFVKVNGVVQKFAKE